jgi:UDP-N-acetylmuramoylalanine--D-glutamate ligase
VSTHETFRSRRVSVIGLGRFGGGVAAARWLCNQGARVTVSDQAPAEALAASVAELAELPITFHLGGHHREDFLDADLLVINPAIPPEHALLTEARQAGVAMTTEMNLFLERCPCRVIGITGSVGKSTTTAMTGELLAERYTTHVGGNIGKSLLGDLDAIGPDDLAVVELSSFQLERLPAIDRCPDVALVTNLTQNHLDRHGSMDRYAEAKKNIFRKQRPDDLLILNRADKVLAAWAGEAPGRVDWFGPSFEPFELAVPGLHNQANAQAAWAIARQFDVDRPTAERVLGQFAGLSHRLEFVAEVDRVRYFNDSKCTTPAGAIVAMDAFPPRRTVLLCGGHDKGVGFDEFAQVIDERARTVVTFGATRGRILQALCDCRRDRHPPEAVSVQTLEEAFAAAVRLARPGDVVLLSPACSSYDQFANYEQRGETFRKLVKDLQAK